MVTGKTGAGKSSLINGLIGFGRVANEGKDLGGVTRGVTSYSKEINGVQFNIWDTPGLQDTTESDDVIPDYITAKLKQHLEGTDIHLFLYCHRMDTDRLKRSDELVFERLTDHFGPKIWEISVIALTFANTVVPPEFIDEIEDEYSKREVVQKYFKQRPIEYKNKIVDMLKRSGMDEQKASQIAVIPTGYHKKTPNPYKVLDIEDWFNPFWITCAERMKGKPYRMDFVKRCKTKEASHKEDMLKRQIEENKNKIQTKQHQDMLKRMQQEHEARMREQEKKILKEKEKWQKKQLEETKCKLQEMEREMRNKLKIELEKMKGKNNQPS